MATLESKKAATLGKRSIIGMILGLALGAILCFVPNGYIRDDILTPMEKHALCLAA